MPEGLTPSDAEVRKLMGLDIEPVSQERIMAAFPTEDLRRAMSLINAETMPRKSAVEHKKRTATEIREKNLIDQTILKQYPTVYVGSGVDIEYPLTLGARKVEMVDPIFHDERAVSDLITELTKIAGEAPKQTSKNNFEFHFDFGDGDEKVTITVSPTLYAQPGADRIFSQEEDSIPLYDLPERVGMILGFRTTGVDIDSDKRTIANLVPGGYLLADHVTASFIREAQELKGEAVFSGIESQDVKGLQKEVWGKRGFQFIPLEHEEDSYQYTFVRKF